MCFFLLLIKIVLIYFCLFKSKYKVWQKNLLIDKIYGEVSLEASPNNETTSIEYEINASRNDIEAGVKPAGTLLIELISKKDIKGL